MRILITAGPTREPLDAVRYLGNRSSGKMGAALAAAALRAGYEPTLVLGPVCAAMPAGVRRVDVETARQMHDAVLREFPRHALLVMAAAVADYRPKTVHAGKLVRDGALTVELEPTVDIVAAACSLKRPDQRVVGFSLEAGGGVGRAREKLLRKNLDMIVYNPADTMNSETIEAVLLYPDGRAEDVPCRAKANFADTLLQRSALLFG